MSQAAGCSWLFAAALRVLLFSTTPATPATPATPVAAAAAAAAAAAVAPVILVALVGPMIPAAMRRQDHAAVALNPAFLGPPHPEMTPKPQPGVPPHGNPAALRCPIALPANSPRGLC